MDAERFHVHAGYKSKPPYEIHSTGVDFVSSANERHFNRIAAEFFIDGLNFMKRPNTVSDSGWQDESHYSFVLLWFSGIGNGALLVCSGRGLVAGMCVI